MNTEEINGYPVPTLEAMNEHFADYEVQMLVGVGSSGAVFYASRDGKTFAIKILVGAQNIRTKLEFKSEAEAMQAMDHPNVIKVYDYGEMSGNPFLVMDYVARGTLHAIMKEFNFDDFNIASMMVMICEGVEHIHEKGYIHRDIKPDNIMIDEDWSPKIMDFGLAVHVDNDTLGNNAVGSKGYAAPEAAADPKNIDFRVDVYAVGGVLYSMLCKEIPHATDPDFEKLSGHDVRFKMIVKNAMNPDVDKRSESVAVVRGRLMNMMKSWELRK